jgi:hypothetical protein
MTSARNVVVGAGALAALILGLLGPAHAVDNDGPILFSRGNLSTNGISTNVFTIAPMPGSCAAGSMAIPVTVAARRVYRGFVDTLPDFGDFVCEKVVAQPFYVGGDLVCLIYKMSQCSPS